MQQHCETNAFCSLLTSEQRARLCPHCIQTVWTRGYELSVPDSQKYATLICSGLLVSMTSKHYETQKTIVPYVSGDFLSYFAFAPECIHPFTPGSITCIKDSSVIQFPIDIIRDLFMENPNVAKYMLQASNAQHLRSHAYLHFVLQQDSYNALIFLLNFCKQHHVPRLTYDELAKISNLHRVTVTRTMKEILRSKDFQA